MAKSYKTEIVPAYKKAHVPSFVLVRNGPFGNAYEFTLLTPIVKFAEFDAAGPLGKAMTADQRSRVEAELSECVTGVFDVALLSQPDISVVKHDVAVPSLVMVQTVTMTPKDMSPYLAFLKDEMRPIIQKSGVDAWLVYRHVFGSDGNQITILRSISSYGELDMGPLTSQIVGPDEAIKLGIKGSQFLHSSRVTVAQYDKEISYGKFPIW